MTSNRGDGGDRGGHRTLETREAAGTPPFSLSVKRLQRSTPGWRQIRTAQDHAAAVDFEFGAAASDSAEGLYLLVSFCTGLRRGQGG
jgi:hypothetical protein